jgi:hypothetical protein
MTRQEIEHLLRKAFDSGWMMSRKWPNHAAYDLEVKWAQTTEPTVPLPLPFLSVRPKHNLSQFQS